MADTLVESSKGTQQPEPTATKADVQPQANPKVSRRNPLPVESDRQQTLETVRKAMAAKDGTPAKTDPKPEVKADTPDDAATPAKAAEPEQKPAEIPPIAPTPETESSSVKVTGLDKEGKKAEIEVSFAQAQSALLRDKFPPEFVANMSRTDILRIGAERFVERQDNDRRWNQANEERRRLTEQTDKSGSPAKAASQEQPVPTPAAAPAQAAQPSPQPPQATALASTSLNAELQAISDAAGPEIAKAIGDIFAKLPKPPETTVNPQFDALSKTADELKRQLHEQRGINESLLNFGLQARFDQAFTNLAKEFPQLEEASGDALRADIQANATAIAQSGRFENPFDSASFRTIVREAAYARLGPLQKETNARQLIASQQQQAKGQIVASPSREDATAQAVSPIEIMKRAAMHAIQTGDKDGARKLTVDLLKQAG